jgi:hypothetical protein
VLPSAQPAKPNKKYTQASFQSIFGGLFYLTTALVMWNAYWAVTEDHKTDRRMWALDEVLGRLQRSPRGDYNHPTPPPGGAGMGGAGSSAFPTADRDVDVIATTAGALM